MCHAQVIPSVPTRRHIFDALLDAWTGTGRHRIVQVAVAGRWEEARGVQIPIDEGTSRSLVRDAGALDLDVAAEIEWLGHPLVFVGARRAQEQGGHTGFEDDVVRVAALESLDPALALATLAGGRPANVSHIELGAANAWQSVGPMRLWTRGRGVSTGTIAARLNKHPALARCIAPVALEVAFNRPRECWIGVEISEPHADGHVVAPVKIEAMLERLLHLER